MTEKVVRIGGASAAWGDTILGAEQLVRKGAVDYLVGDYLAEVTMALLARARSKAPEAGFIPDWIQAVKPLLPEIKTNGIRLVTDSGGMNPLACRDAFVAAAEEAGLSFRIAVVTGDDLKPAEAAIRAKNPPEMFSGAPLPPALASINAYLGAVPIAAAFSEGAEVVITGRVVDSALALGPLMHEFGWTQNQYDLLAAGSLAGHVIECGAQTTGGLFTDWQEVADGWDHMGFPIVECSSDGSFVVTKPEGTGGMVTVGTVGEQIVYEIGDPQAYRLPDVTCDFSGVKLDQIGKDRVRVSNARGRAPGADYKVCGTWLEGHRLISTFMIAGWQAAAKGRRAAEALISRTERIVAAQGFGPYRETSIEVIGAEDTYGANRRAFEAREVIVKVGLRHDDPKALDVFAREFATPAVSMAQGITGAFGGRPKPGPVLKVHSFLWPKDAVPVGLHIGDETRDVTIAYHVAEDAAPTAAEGAPAADLPDRGAEVLLRALAWGRSGDKGNHANIGIIARRPEFAPWLKAQVTAERVAEFFAHYLEGRVRRYELPGFHAFNFLLENVLGGGGTASLRYDPQAKTYAQMLLDLPVTVPAAWLEEDGVLAGWRAN